MPPAAPVPINNTSVFGSGLLMVLPLVFGNRDMLRFRRGVNLLVLFRPDELDTGVSHQVPPDEIRIATMDRVAEHSLARILQKHREKAVWRICQRAILSTRKH